MKKMIITIPMMIAVLFLSSCGKKSDKDTLVYGLGADVINLDPGKTSDTTSSSVVANVCEGLVSYVGETNTHLEPLLAKSWDISNDGLTYTFHLREGVKFHDGTDFNADAVLFSYNRQQEDSHPFHDAYSYWTGTGMKADIKSITKLDDMTIVFKLNHPKSTFLARLALRMGTIVSPTAVQKMGLVAFNTAPVCAGPFVFKKWEKEQVVLIERNDNYWDKEHMPKVKKIIYKIIKDSSVRLLALKKGELDIAESVQPQDVDQLKSDSSLNVVSKNILSVNYLVLNTEKPPLNDVRVRRALAHLMDKKAIVEAASRGQFNVSKSHIPMAMFGYDDSIQDYEVNVEEAKKLLAEAGYPNGLELTITFNQENNVRKAVAEILQNQFAKGGVKVNIQMMEWGTMLSRVKDRDYNGTFIYAWVADFLDPDNFFTTLFSAAALKKPALNTSGWSNAEFDGILEKATLSTNENERKSLYAKAQQILHDEQPFIPLFESTRLYAVQKNVKNFVVLPLGYPEFKTVEKE